MSKNQGRNSKQKNALKDKLIKMFGYDCHYCHGRMRRGGPLNGLLMTIEHIVPLEDGGTWALYNLVLACYDCNHNEGSHIRQCNCERCNDARISHRIYSSLR